MRTTVEIKDENRARLLQMAAQRGEKGFSSLVNEALERYFDQLGQRAKLTREALAALGTLDDEAADQLEHEVRSLRKSWR
jgi:hypothetical protein